MMVLVGENMDRKIFLVPNIQGNILRLKRLNIYTYICVRVPISTYFFVPCLQDFVC